tara:strand:+ start:2449 stop:2841 length:393 start_codon:yes stop_codon:yes gene_type:complete
MRTSDGFRPTRLPPPDFGQFLVHQRMKEQRVRHSMFGRPFTQKANDFMAIHQQTIKNHERDLRIKEAQHKRDVEIQQRHKQEKQKKQEDKKVLKVVGTEKVSGTNLTRPKLDYKKGKNVNDLLKGLANID